MKLYKMIEDTTAYRFNFRKGTIAYYKLSLDKLFMLYSPLEDYRKEDEDI